MKKVVLLVASIICLILTSCNKTEGSFVLRAPVSEDSSIVPNSAKPSSTNINNTSSHSSSSNSSVNSVSSSTNSYSSSITSSSDSPRSSSNNSSSFISSSSNPSSSSTNLIGSLPVDSSSVSSSNITSSDIGIIDDNVYYYQVINSTIGIPFDYEHPICMTAVIGSVPYILSSSDAYSVLSNFDNVPLKYSSAVTNFDSFNPESTVLGEGFRIEARYSYSYAGSNTADSIVYFYICENGRLGFINKTLDTLYYSDDDAIDYKNIKTLISSYALEF